MEENVKTAVKELETDATIEKVSDERHTVYGVMKTPVSVDEQVKAAGSTYC